MRLCAIVWNNRLYCEVAKAMRMMRMMIDDHAYLLAALPWENVISKMFVTNAGHLMRWYFLLSLNSVSVGLVVRMAQKSSQFLTYQGCLSLAKDYPEHIATYD